MNKKISIESFEHDPIPKAVIKNAFPALIAMVMVMVYNFADTFFLGLTHNDFLVTAVSFGSPVFMIFMSLGTLFGVGGTAVISRAIGAGDPERVKKASSFCIWCSVGVGLVLMAVLWIFIEPFAKMLGAEKTLEYTLTYLRIVIGCGVFSMLSNCFSNILRAEGKPMVAMAGTVAGNLLNLILDPILILLFNWGIAGAAIATVIGNVVAVLFYLVYFMRKKSSQLSISPKHFSGKDGIAKSVIAIGISASLANLLSSLVMIIVNEQLSSFDELYVAGYGVAMKVSMIVMLIGIGFGAGVQPLFGYLYGAKNKKRLTESIKFSLVLSLGICILLAVLCFIFSPLIVKVILADVSAYSSGIHFTRILMSAVWLIGPFIIFTNVLQAMGAATQAIIATVVRQAVIFIPAIFIMKAVAGLDGIIWAQPIADVLSVVFVAILAANKMKKGFSLQENNAAEIE